MTVAELLADPKRWTKRLGIRRVPGEMTAVCLDTAIRICYGGQLDHEPYMALYERVQQAIHRRGFDKISQFNDDPQTTHADVLELVKECGI